MSENSDGVDVGEYVLLDRGISQMECDEGDRIYVKCFAEDGTVLFHGEVTGAVRVEVVPPKTRAPEFFSPQTDKKR